jgi:hypothetical protein
VAVAGGEIAEGHLVCAAYTGIQVVDLTGEPVRRKPLRNCIGFEEGTIDALRSRAQNAVQTDGSGSHGVIAFQ